MYLKVLGPLHMENWTDLKWNACFLASLMPLKKLRFVKLLQVEALHKVVGHFPEGAESHNQLENQEAEVDDMNTPFQRSDDDGFISEKEQNNGELDYKG